MPSSSPSLLRGRRGPRSSAPPGGSPERADPRSPSATGPRRLDDVDWTAWAAVDRATLTFVIEDGRLLLIRKKRGLGAGKINGPGGRLEPGETPWACAIREVEEELGITPHGLAERGELRFQFTDGYSIHVHVFSATGYAGRPRETEEAIPLWFAFDAVPYEEMWADDVLWLPRLIAGEPVGGRFVFDGDTMLDHALD